MISLLSISRRLDERPGSDDGTSESIAAQTGRQKDKVMIIIRKQLTKRFIINLKPQTQPLNPRQEHNKKFSYRSYQD